MRAWSLVALMIAGCGGGDSADITGWYGSVVKLEGMCGSIADENQAPAFVLVDSVGSATYVRGCVDMNASNCLTTSFDYNEPIQDGLATEGGGAFFIGECTLAWERSTATLIGTTLRVHTQLYGSTGGLSEAECTPEAAQALTVPCVQETEVTATKL